MTQNITNFDYVVLIDASGSMANTDGYPSLAALIEDAVNG